MKKTLLLNLAFLSAASLFAEKIEVKQFRYATPIVVNRPYMVDSVNVNSKAFTDEMLLDSYTNFSALGKSDLKSAGDIPVADSDCSINLISFTIENNDFVKGDLSVKGLTNYQLFVDGKKVEASSVSLEPATHNIVIKYLSKKGIKEVADVSFETKQNTAVFINRDGGNLYTIKNVLKGKRVAGASMSPSGKYVIVKYKNTLEGGTVKSCCLLKEVATGKIVSNFKEDISWMPISDCVYYVGEEADGKSLITFNPATGKETTLAKDIPEGYFYVSPCEDYLLYSITQKGPKEKKEIYQVLEPDDRQPGWRDRNSLYKYDLKSGTMQPVTFGYHNVHALDISKDGRYALLMVSSARLTKRPTTLFSIYRLDMKTLKAETLVKDDGFVSNAGFSPEGDKIFITGSPEALGGIGKNLPDGRIPSMIDNQLFVMDIATKKIKPMTKDFNPNVESVDWSGNDGKIYFTAENRDLISMYRLDPSTGKIDIINSGEDIVSSFSLAGKSNVGVYYGQSASNSDRIYIYDAKSQKCRLFEDLSKEILSGIELGECHEWNFQNSRGDTIYGRYYLPPHFDASKSYPLIVNYYGGCSPTSRNFESRYPHHAYAALGYVVYVVEPSGATGFGQEFSSRHVNTAGQGVAQDIIEGTKQFVKEHSYVNGKKIGCIGASYGGFMSQHLQTQTDMFACAISHAGISDHTSYWGEGYWGYSYSEVSMADSYPWKDADLFVKQSPLFNAYKVKTPLLFLHGSADNNVPVGESIQMFTALKLLGKETAMVIVDGQDHHILDYEKRLAWQNTIYAWFAKWLKEKPEWWNEIYSPKSL